jgi:signal transduction histidine kinase/ActR/RegA family two-component response regulator
MKALALRSRWRNASLRNKVFSAVAMAIIPLLVAIGLLAQQQHNGRIQDARLTAHRESRVIQGELIKMMVDGETAVRGFLLTQDPSFLAPFDKAKRDVPVLLESLAQHEAKEDHQDLTRLHALVDRELEMLGVMVARPLSDRDIRTAKLGMDDLRSEIDQISSVEDADVRRLLGAQSALADLSLLILVLGGLGAVAGALIAGGLVMGGIVKRLRLVTENAGRLVGEDELEEFRLDEDEIGVLALRIRDTAALLRTRDKALHQAVTEADHANSSKSEFLSRMSHELRTPLNGILGFSQLLEMDGDLTPDQRESITQIGSAGSHLLSLINEVLDLSRIEAGHLSVSLEPVSLDEIVGECVALMKPLANQRGLTLVVESDPEQADLFARADRQRLKQLLLNLLSNATKYNRAGGKITVAYGMHADGLNEISVTDTGLGIPPDKLERLFVPFDRLDIPDEQEQGTGLGLSLSEKLARLMDGALSVVSEVGHGTRFSLLLRPATAPVEAIQAMPTLDIGQPHIASEDWSEVLYIEDNPSNTRLVERILKRRPFVRLHSVMQGQLGLELAHELIPEMILLDMNLPDMTGDDVLARLRSDPATASIPVVMLSADATKGQIQRMLEAGAAAYITKPLDVRKFLDTIDEVLMTGAHVHV